MKELKLGVVGSRNFSDYSLMKEKLDEIKKQTDMLIIVSGGSKGADNLAEQYAKENDLQCIVHKADWNRYAKAAGMIRNRQIVDTSDELIAFWDGTSRGTQNTIRLANQNNKKIKVVLYESNEKTSSS